MNHIPLLDDIRPDTAGAPLGADPADAAAGGRMAGLLRIRAVHRAASDLRRGTPVMIEGATSVVVLPAETAGAQGLEDFAALAAGPGVLLMSLGRAVAVLGGVPGAATERPLSENEIVALRLAPDLLRPEALLSLADPTVEQILPSPPERMAELPDGAQAAIGLVKLARLLPATLIERLRPGGHAIAEARQIQSVDSADILAYPNAMATGLRRVAEAAVPLEGAPDARVIAFRAPDSGIEHLAIMIGRPDRPGSSPGLATGLPLGAPLVRVHSECFTGDLLGSLRCDCGPQLRGAIERMAGEGAGVLLYLAQEGRGIGLVNKLRAYALQDRGLDTVDANQALGWAADERNFLVAATMLDTLGINAVRLLTNNPDKVVALAACGIKVLRREAHAIAPNGVNDGYLGTKARRFGHYLG